MHLVKANIKIYITFLTALFLIVNPVSSGVAYSDGEDPITEPKTAKSPRNQIIRDKMKEIDAAGKRSSRGEVPPIGKKTAPQVSEFDGDIDEMINKADNKAISDMSSNIGRAPHQINDTVYVVPEKKTFVDLSKTDVNRIHCEGDRDMVGAVFSEDKGIVINRSGPDAFLRVVPESYAFQNPFELFMICSSGASNSSLYRMIGTPVHDLSKNVILKNDGEKMIEGINFFKGKTREQAIVDVIKKAWEENWESAWIITPRFRKVLEKPEYSIIWYRSVDTNTEWVVEIYAIESKSENLSIPETGFVNAHTAAVTVIDPVIQNGQMGQVIVIREKASNS